MQILNLTNRLYQRISTHFSIQKILKIKKIEWVELFH